MYIEAHNSRRYNVNNIALTLAPSSGFFGWRSLNLLVFAALIRLIFFAIMDFIFIFAYFFLVVPLSFIIVFLFSFRRLIFGLLLFLVLLVLSCLTRLPFLFCEVLFPGNVLLLLLTSLLSKLLFRFKLGLLLRGLRLRLFDCKENYYKPPVSYEKFWQRESYCVHDKSHFPPCRECPRQS